MKREDETAPFPEPPKLAEIWKISSAWRILANAGFQAAQVLAPSIQPSHSLPFPPSMGSHATTAGQSKDRKFLFSHCLGISLCVCLFLPRISLSEAQTFRKQKPGTLGNTELC